MARTVKEWIGKTDDSAPPTKCKQRILDRQSGKCALTGHVFVPGDTVEYDHITALWLGGANRESNLQAVLGEPHKRKTKAEAGVRAKVMAAAAKHLNIVKPAQPIRSAPFAISPKTAKRQANAAAKLSFPPRVRDVFGRPVAKDSVS